MAHRNSRGRPAGRGAEIQGLDLQIKGLAIPLAGCALAMGALAVLPSVFTLLVVLLVGVCFHHGRRVCRRSTCAR